MGLAPEQVKGYGLGVMNARALFYADKNEAMANYKTEGRAYGPHGEDLVLANSFMKYDDEVSRGIDPPGRRSEPFGTGFGV